MTKEPKYIVKDGKNQVYIALKKIIRFEGAMEYALIFVKNREGAITECGNLGAHEKRLAEYDCFVRIHKSHLVNVNYIVRKDEHGHVLLENGDEIPFTKQYEAALVAAMRTV